jgi:hypothetical protein
MISALLIVTAFSAAAQRTSGVRPSVFELLDRMRNACWTERRTAFTDAMMVLASGKPSVGDADNLRRGLIQLLAIENNENKPTGDAGKARSANCVDEVVPDETAPPGTWSEERSDYYADLIGTVADFGDERAIPVLLAAASTGGMATQGVARFGKKALDPVLEQASGADSELAAGAIFVIMEMLKLHTVSDPTSHRRIKNLLRAALGSPKARLRRCAIYAIEYLDDREEFVPILKQLAEHDSAKLTGQPLNDGSIGDFYYVRYDAQRLLQSIAKHERPATGPIQGH